MEKRAQSEKNTGIRMIWGWVYNKRGKDTKGKNIGDG